MLEQGAHVDGKSSSTLTPLMVAVASGRIKVVMCLVENGAKLNVRNKDEVTALMRAAQSGRLKVGEYLIEAGAKVNAKNKDRKTALMFAVEAGKLKMVELLLANGAKYVNKALLIATEKGNRGIINILEAHLKEGANAEEDENVEESDDETPTAEKCALC